MPNREHLSILHRGVRAWNDWRTSNRDLRPELSNASIGHLNLDKVNLSRANLSHVDLRGGTFRDADLSGADLTQAHLQGAHAYRSLFNDANLAQANLCHAFLNDCCFRGAVFHETILGDTVLLGVKDLDDSTVAGPCVIDFRTLARSGQLPLAFLRRCGLPEFLLDFLPSLLNRPFEFYTCFVSYAEEDDTFTERLYNDLQGRGVRCWRWREDAKVGRTLMRSIDEAVRLYDKLILVCSHNSLESPAVIREMERALQKEDDLARDGMEPEVLFPIRLDDHIFSGWDHYRKADVVQKHVGDFRTWGDTDAYREALDRLVRDLRAEASDEEG